MEYEEYEEYEDYHEHEPDEYNDYDEDNEDNNYEEEDDSEEYNIHTIMDSIALIKSKSHCIDIVFYIKEGFKLEDYLPSCAKKLIYTNIMYIKQFYHVL